MSLSFKQNEELKSQIRQYIIDNPDKPNEAIAKTFKCTTSKVAMIANWLVRNATKVNPHVPHSAGTYTNGEGMKKQEARKAIIIAVKNSAINTGRVLSLPFTTCALEIQLNTKFRNKFRYIACERNPEYYFQMMKTIADQKLRMNTYLGNIADKIYEARQDDYAHLILDYCGQISSFQDEITYAVRNDIVQVGGIIAVTLTKRGELKGRLSEKMSNIPQGFFHEEIGDKTQITAIKTFFTSLIYSNESNYTINTFLEYQDEGKAPMVLVVLKRLS